MIARKVHDCQLFFEVIYTYENYLSYGDVASGYETWNIVSQKENLIYDYKNIKIDTYPNSASSNFREKGCTYELNIDTNGDGVIDTNLDNNGDGIADTNLNQLYASCTEFYYIKITIPVKVSTNGEALADDVLDDIVLFYVGKK